MRAALHSRKLSKLISAPSFLQLQHRRSVLRSSLLLQASGALEWTGIRDTPQASDALYLAPFYAIPRTSPIGFYTRHCKPVHACTLLSNIRLVSSPDPELCFLRTALSRCQTSVMFVPGDPLIGYKNESSHNRNFQQTPIGLYTPIALTANPKPPRQLNPYQVYLTLTPADAQPKSHAAVLCAVGSCDGSGVLVGLGACLVSAD